MKNKINNQRGFSLIETIIYLALYGIIIGGIVISIYGIFESGNRNQTKAMVQEEGTYLLGKIDWALTGATSASVSPSNKLLYVNRNGLPSLDNPLTFDTSGGDMKLSRGIDAPERISNTNVSVTNVNFIHTTESSDGVTPESVKTSFTLSALTPNGMTYSQDFSTIKFLRK